MAKVEKTEKKDQVTDKPSKKIERKHIHKFFAHRYGPGSNADKEYRNFLGAKKRAYQKLVEANFWLDQIK